MKTPLRPCCGVEISNSCLPTCYTQSAAGKTFEERAETVLARTYRGLHHCGDIKKSPIHWQTNHWGTLSTFDHDFLTRLVIAAHDNMIRATIQCSGPNMVKIVLHNRTCREGDYYDRHPTIEEAIQTYREGKR